MTADSRTPVTGAATFAGHAPARPHPCPGTWSAAAPRQRTEGTEPVVPIRHRRHDPGR